MTEMFLWIMSGIALGFAIGWTCGYLVFDAMPLSVRVKYVRVGELKPMPYPLDEEPTPCTDDS